MTQTVRWIGLKNSNADDDHARHSPHSDVKRALNLQLKLQLTKNIPTALLQLCSKRPLLDLPLLHHGVPDTNIAPLQRKLNFLTLALLQEDFREPTKLFDRALRSFRKPKIQLRKFRACDVPGVCDSGFESNKLVVQICWAAFDCQPLVQVEALSGKFVKVKLPYLNIVYHSP